jgi:hypothetical protein
VRRNGRYKDASLADTSELPFSTLVVSMIKSEVSSTSQVPLAHTCNPNFSGG